MWRLGVVQISVLASAGFLAGCASLSKSECSQGDWRAIGYSDGDHGQPFSRVSKHIKACKFYGVIVDIETYRQGRRAGLRPYCTARGGYDSGRLGRGYHNVCPPAQEPGFIAGYQLGRGIYQAQEDVRSAKSKITSAEYTLDATESRIDNLLAELRDTDDKAERKEISRKIDSERSSARSARRKLPEARRQLTAATNRLEQARDIAESDISGLLRKWPQASIEAMALAPEDMSTESGGQPSSGNPFKRPKSAKTPGGLY